MDAPVAELTGVFDVVVANIELGPLFAMAEALAARVGRGGCLLLTGFLHDRTEEVERVFSHLGLGVTGIEHKDPWVLVSLCHG